jgi:hypothetical protein
MQALALKPAQKKLQVLPTSLPKLRNQCNIATEFVCFERQQVMSPITPKTG